MTVSILFGVWTHNNEGGFFWRIHYLQNSLLDAILMSDSFVIITNSFPMYVRVLPLIMDAKTGIVLSESKIITSQSLPSLLYRGVLVDAFGHEAIDLAGALVGDEGQLPIHNINIVADHGTSLGILR